MDNSLSKQYIHRRLHGQPPSPEQALAFFDFLPWKPVHDEVLRGNCVLPSGKRISVLYSEDEALSAANVYSAEHGPMERWFEEHTADYAALTEDELWKKFNYHYLNFLINRRPGAAPCYTAQYTRPDGTEQDFPSPNPNPERKDYVPTSRAFLLEADWQWHALMMLLTKVAEHVMDEEKAFELIVRLAEQASFKPERQARLGAFIRDRLRQYPDVNKTKLGEVVGLNYDQVLRLEDKDPVSPAGAVRRATRELETLLLQLKKEVS